MARKLVGHVQQLFLHPVKSMRGYAVDEVSCYWYGVNGDRKYGFTRVGNLSGFPWLTARELPALLQYEPYLVEPDAPLKSAVRVRAPEGEDLPVNAPALQERIAAAYGGPVELIRLKRGTFDCQPLSIMSAGTLAALDTAVGQELDRRRFRANIVVDCPAADEENTWFDGALLFGDDDTGARAALTYDIKRCMIINLDPDSGASDPGVLRGVARSRGVYAGVYASVTRPGVIRVGDPVYLETGRH